MLKTQMDRRSFMAASGAAVALGLAMGSRAFASESGSKDAKDASAASGTDYDIVVVGMGGAGMCAALAAKEAGVENVVILEKTEIVGGNTNFSSSGMNAAATRFQQEAGGDAATDTVDLFISDTMKGGHNYNNLELVKKLCGDSAAAIDWLDGHGITLSDITTLGGASVPRCHRPADKSAVGSYIVPLLEQLMHDNGIDIVMGCKVTSLVKDDSGAVVGVTAESADGVVEYSAKAVILATGGFGANFDMIKMYRPDMDGFVTTNAQGAQGDGMVMAQAAGANLVQMDQIQAHPTVYQENGALIGEAVRGSGAILINNLGQRFTNEMGTRDAVSAAELAQPDGKVWVLYDQNLYDNTPVTAKYEKRGMSIKGETLEDLASQLGVDAAALQETLDTYNKAVADGGASDPFGRTTGLVDPLETAPFYAIPLGPGVHHTMGGILVSAKSEALTITSEVVPGLYAAGETTGGIHGSNRLGGNAVADIVVMGKNAGEQAAAYIA